MPAPAGYPMAQPAFYSPAQRPAQRQSPASGGAVALGIISLILSVLGMLLTLTLQGMVWAEAHNHLTVSGSMVTFLNDAGYAGAVVLALSTVLGAISARRGRSGVAIAALVICGLSGAILYWPVYL